MSRLPLWCEMCTRLKDSSYDEERDNTTYYCEAYPEGIPEAVFYSGHLYPKPNDNGLQFKIIEGFDFPEYLKQTQEEEDKNYRDSVDYYEELNMIQEEFQEKMKREHGDDYIAYIQPISGYD